VTVTAEDVREMLTLLDRYRYEVEMMTQQLNMLTATEQELGAAWDFLETFEEVEPGSEVLIPIGGGMHVSGNVTKPDRVIAAVGADLHAELDPNAAAQRVGERRDQVREMMQQVRASIEQREASAQALSQQAEAAFQELQASKGMGP
jgi:prefoldin alpha subunit